MAPFAHFEQRMWELIHQGNPVDHAFQLASQEYSDLADQADKLLEIKQQIEWELKSGLKNECKVDPTMHKPVQEHEKKADEVDRAS